jgi:hypothetical protein
MDNVQNCDSYEYIFYSVNCSQYETIVYSLKLIIMNSTGGYFLLKTMAGLKKFQCFRKNSN